MKKLLCIREYKGKLTKNKLYDVKYVQSTIGDIPVYLVVVDSGYSDWIAQSYFVDIQDERVRKLKELGI